jgi:hypothetical protein
MSNLGMVFALKIGGVNARHNERRSKMRKKMNLIFLCALLAVTAGISSCRPYAGFEFYSRTPRFTKNHPSHVMLITHRPRRDHIVLGEVWIKTDPRKSRRFVEKKLRKKAARMGADAVVITEDRYSRDRMAYRRYRRGTTVYKERIFGGVAIRFR